MCNSRSCSVREVQHETDNMRPKVIVGKPSALSVYLHNKFMAVVDQ